MENNLICLQGQFGNPSYKTVFGPTGGTLICIYVIIAQGVACIIIVAVDNLDRLRVTKLTYTRAVKMGRH